MSEWLRDAACGHYRRGVRDLWSLCVDEDEAPDPRDRAMLTFLGGYICRRCPVMEQCRDAALDLLAREGPQLVMLGGLTPDELKELARSRAMPARKVAQHGTRSRYTAGCRCPGCKRAHADYEHDRRLQRGK